MNKRQSIFVLSIYVDLFLFFHNKIIMLLSFFVNAFHLTQYNCQYQHHIGRAAPLKDRNVGPFVAEYGWALCKLVAATLQKIKIK